MFVPQISLDRIYCIRKFSIDSIVFGIGAIDKVGKEAKNLGANKVAIITDKGIQKAGLLRRVEEKLEREELVFDINIQLGTSEATVATVNSIGEWVRKGKFDFVVGLGGGTACDASKLASYLATNPGDVTDHLGYNGFRAILGGKPKPWEREPIPSMTVVTTAGSGAEITQFGGATLEGVGKGWAPTPNSPRLAIVDPSMTFSLSPRQTAATGVDGLNHMIMHILTKTPLPLADALALEGIRLYASNLRNVTSDGKNVRGRWSLSLASLLWGLMPCWDAGNAHKNACIANYVGPKYNIPHGLVIAAILPYCMQFSLSAAPERLALIASEGYSLDTNDLSAFDSACKAVEATADLIEDLDLPSCLEEYHVPREDLSHLIDYFMKNCVPTLSDPQPFTLENVSDLFMNMWQGRKNH